jgi:DNA-binding transcriptional LysR family regulator
MIAIQAGTVRYIICASPGYLSRHGSPLSPDDLAQHRCISFARSEVPATWAFKMPSGEVRRMSIHARLTLNSIEGIVEAALRDGGLAMMYSYQSAHHIADGALEIVLNDYEIEPLPVSIVYPQGRLVPQKVRAFIDFAMPRLRARLAGIAAQCSI